MTARSEIIQVDWRGFREYLEELGLSRKRRKDLLRYAMRHYALLWVEPVEAAAP